MIGYLEWRQSKLLKENTSQVEAEIQQLVNQAIEDIVKTVEDEVSKFAPQAVAQSRAATAAKGLQSRYPTQPGATGQSLAGNSGQTPQPQGRAAGASQRLQSRYGASQEQPQPQSTWSQWAGDLAGRAKEKAKGWWSTLKDKTSGLRGKLGQWWDKTKPRFMAAENFADLVTEREIREVLYAHGVKAILLTEAGVLDILRQKIGGILQNLGTSIVGKYQQAQGNPPQGPQGQPPAPANASTPQPQQMTKEQLLDQVRQDVRNNFQKLLEVGQKLPAQLSPNTIRNLLLNLVKKFPDLLKFYFKGDLNQFANARRGWPQEALNKNRWFFRHPISKLLKDVIATPAQQPQPQPQPQPPGPQPNPDLQPQPPKELEESEVEQIYNLLKVREGKIESSFRTILREIKRNNLDVANLIKKLQVKLSQGEPNVTLMSDRINQLKRRLGI